MMRRARFPLIFSISLLLIPGIVKAKGRKPPVITLLIVALGDSTTSGAPYYHSPVEDLPLGSGDFHGQYAYWIMHRRPHWQVFNAGVTGQGTEQIRQRLSENLALHPKYLIILGGVNDIFQGVPPAKIEQNLLAMYRAAKTSGTLPIAASILPFDRATPAQAKLIRKINDWIKKTAGQENIPFADLYQAVTKKGHPDQLRHSPDGFHPDITGYRAMGEALVKVIDAAQAGATR